MTLGARSIVVFPFHITLLNFSDEGGRKRLQSDRTVCAYLPVKFDAVSNSSANSRKVDGEKRLKDTAISQNSILKALQEGIEFSLGNVKKYKLAGLECGTSNTAVFCFT